MRRPRQAARWRRKAAGSLALALQKAPVAAQQMARPRPQHRAMTRETAATQDLAGLRAWLSQAHRVTAGSKGSPAPEPKRTAKLWATDWKKAGASRPVTPAVGQEAKARDSAE